MLFILLSLYYVSGCLKGLSVFILHSVRSADAMCLPLVRFLNCEHSAFAFYFQVAPIVIASRAESTAWQSPETIFKRAASEFKNCFRVAYPKKRQCKKSFQAA
ncbi:MAG: hypothetical protein J6M43_06965 [Neisseriaceae bacterium]|nr:hypothetical protein [Neisseriaceae bacterium]